jgi:hypothetical protein
MTAFGKGERRNYMIVVRPPKSVGVAVVLSFLFGPFGMFYSTVTGALVILAIDFVLIFISVATLGIGGVLYFLTWIGGIIWAAMAASKHNAMIAAAAIQIQSQQQSQAQSNSASAAAAGNITVAPVIHVMAPPMSGPYGQSGPYQQPGMAQPGSGPYQQGQLPGQAQYPQPGAMPQDPYQQPAPIPQQYPQSGPPQSGPYQQPGQYPQQ